MSACTRCGPTVYGPAHVGNFRAFLLGDLLRRYLEWSGFRVTWVMNITDVDDRIIRDLPGGGRDARRADRAAHRPIHGRPEDAAHRSADAPDAGDRAHPGDGGAHRHAAREGPRLPDRRRLDLLPHLVLAGVRHAGQARSAGGARRRARRGRRLRQGRRARLRAVEGAQAGRAVVARPRSARAGRAGTSSARR